MKTTIISNLDKVLDISLNFPEKIKKEDIRTVEKIMKIGISEKNFELVSISMSVLAYLKFKKENVSSYRTYAFLNDAKYLAVTSNLYMAQKINYFSSYGIRRRKL